MSMCGSVHGVCVLEDGLIMKEHTLRGTGPVLITCSNTRTGQEEQ